MAILSLHGAELPAVEAANLSNYTPIFQKDDKSLVKIASDSPVSLADTFYDYYLNVHKFLLKAEVQSVWQVSVSEILSLTHNSNIEVVSGKDSIETTLINDKTVLYFNIQPTHSFSDGIMNFSLWRKESNTTIQQQAVLYDKTNSRFETTLEINMPSSTWIIEGFFVFLPPVT